MAYLCTASILALVLFASTPSISLADAGGDFFLAIAGIQLAILVSVIVIAIEVFIFKHGLSGIGFWQTCKIVGPANVVSAIVGSPLAISWTYLSSDRSGTFVAVSFAIAFTISFLVSVYLEYFVIKLRHRNKYISKRLVWKMNAFSYAFLILLLVPLAATI